MARVTFQWKDYARGGKPGAMTDGNGVLALFLPACVTEGIRQNPLFWFSRESIPRAVSPALPAIARSTRGATSPFRNISVKIHLL
jgi:hypothetical protein